MQVALGKKSEKEMKENSKQFEKYLKGNCGLFFSNESPDKIIDYFKEYKSPYFGNVGTISNQTIILKRGFDERLNDFPSSMESQFRQLGLKVKLDGGKFYLLDEFIICEKGKPLNTNQSKMIKHLGICLDEFKIYIKAYLGKNGEFVEVKDTDNT